MMTGVLFVSLVLLWSVFAHAVSFPVSYSTDARYLVDSTGAPFPILGRTAWFVTSLSQPDYQTFLDDTAAKGFTAIELHALNHDPRGNNEPFGGNGALPFTKKLDSGTWTGSLTYSNINTDAPDFTTPNTSYWTHVDGLLNYAESKNILALFFPAYVGYQGGEQGWLQEMVANGTTRLQTYGAWVANRYKDQKNLVWMMGGDMGTSPDTFSPAQSNVEQALLTGINSVTGKQSNNFSAEWTSGSIASDQPTFGSSMTLNGCYSWADVVNQCRRAYAHTPPIPAFFLEGPYDEEGPGELGYNPYATQPVRRYNWWAWLSTIGGYVTGNGYVWQFNTGWQSHLNGTGAQDLARLNAFIKSQSWYTLVPSGLNGMKTLITAGAGTIDTSTYVASAANPSGTLLIAYIAPGHSGTITVDMTALSTTARGRWFDPTNGTYTTVTGSPFANTGTRVFTPPGNNSVGYTDWVLMLDTR